MSISGSFTLCKKNLLPHLQVLQFEYSLKDKLEGYTHSYFAETSSKNG